MERYKRRWSVLYEGDVGVGSAGDGCKLKMDAVVSSLVVQFLRGGGSGETVDGENVRGEKVGSELERVLRDLSVDGEVVEFHGSISSSSLSSCCCCPPWSYCDYCTCWVFWFLSSLVVAVVMVVLSSIDVL